MKSERHVCIHWYHSECNFFLSWWINYTSLKVTSQRELLSSFCSHQIQYFLINKCAMYCWLIIGLSNAFMCVLVLQNHSKLVWSVSLSEKNTSDRTRSRIYDTDACFEEEFHRQCNVSYTSTMHCTLIMCLQMQTLAQLIQMVKLIEPRTQIPGC